MTLLEVFQINANKAFAAAVDLNSRLEILSQYLCLVTEPYKVKCKLTNKPLGAKCLVIKSQIPPRAAIFYKGVEDLIMIDVLSNEDCVVGLFNTDENKLLIASVYLDITKCVSPPWLERVVEYWTLAPLLTRFVRSIFGNLYGITAGSRTWWNGIIIT